jgi:hypothetical protein
VRAVTDNSIDDEPLQQHVRPPPPPRSLCPVLPAFASLAPGLVRSLPASPCGTPALTAWCARRAQRLDAIARRKAEAAEREAVLNKQNAEFQERLKQVRASTRVSWERRKKPQGREWIVAMLLFS